MTTRASVIVVVLLAVMRPISARAEAPVDETELARPKLGPSLLAGFVVPICSGDSASCAGTSLGLGPNCGVSDATASPMVAWGFAFRAGATFDLPLR